MMMTIIFLWLIVLLASLIIIRLRRQNRQATLRRHLREPHMSHERVTAQESQDKIRDANETLGLLQEAPTHFSDEESVRPVISSSMSLEYIAIHLIAPRDCPYGGYELLQSLLANGLRYGEKNIFHRYETKTGQGRMLFSLASVNKPGTFELSKMGGFSCPGLTLFMVLRGLADPSGTLDTMLEVAKQLMEDLGGELYDAEHQTLSMEQVVALRTRVRQFEENRRVPDLFELR